MENLLVYGGWATGLGELLLKPIGADVIEARMRDLGQTTVNQTIALFKGATFALAAVLLLEIVATPDARGVRLMLWLAAFLVSLVSYNAHLNTSVVDFRESVSSIVVIVIQMMAELMLFVVLTPRAGEQAWRTWILIYALFQAATAIRLSVPLNKGVAFDPAVRPLLDAVEAGRRFNSRFIFAHSMLSLAIGVAAAVLAGDSPWPQWLCLGYGALVGAWALNGLFGMHAQREMMEQKLRDALTAPTVS